MTRERWRQIEEAFERAIECPRDQRGAMIAGLEDTVRAEVQTLLTHAEERKDHGARIVSRAARRMRTPTTQVGRRLGPYRLVSELGRGGMGTVYLATRDDDQYRTEVAIKVLLRGHESAHAMARFRDERQILATLEHPSIVRLLDGGTSEDGVPYLVMERIQGVPITKFAKDRNLSISERVELFRKVCAAVQFAHMKAVIHRDLKPSNILVTQDGVPKLLDFGIAKLADSTGDIKREAETRTGMLMLTPEYASPEQVRGEQVTTASDVYSLGAVLYELVTGAPAHRFDGGGIETLLAILDKAPARPSAAASSENHQRALAGDLDNVILKSLDKEPHRRYASAEHFSEDLRRHLDGLPVEARAATWTYRASKFIRRNRLAVGAAGLVTVALAAASVVSIQQARRAEAEARTAERATRRAEQRFDDVRRLANTLLFEVDERIANLSGSTGARELIVGRALAYLDQLAREADGNPALQRELALGYMKIGDIQGSPLVPNLGQQERGLASYAKAGEIIGRLVAAGQDARDLEVNVRVGSGMLHRNHDDTLARTLLSEAVERAGTLPPTPELHRSLAEAELGLAELAFNAQDTDAAQRHARRCQDAATAWSRMTPGAPLPRYFIGIANELKAHAAVMLGDPDTAVAELEQARTLFTDLVALHAEDARYRRELGLVLTLIAGYRAGKGAGDLWQPHLDDRDGARKVLEQAITLLGRAVEADPADTRGRLDLALAHIQLALVSSPPEDLAALDRARSLYEPLTPQERKDSYAMNIAWMLDCASAGPVARTRPAEAAAVLAGALQASTATEYPLADVQCEYLISDARRRIQGMAAAKSALVASIAKLRTKLAETPRAIMVRIGLVDTLLLQHQLDGSCTPAREALTVWQQLPAQPTSYTVRRMGTLEATAHACEENRDRR